MATVLLGRACQVIVGGQDISNMVTSLSITADVDSVVETTITLVGSPTFADGVLRIDPGPRVGLVETGDGPVRAINLRGNEGTIEFAE